MVIGNAGAPLPYVTVTLRASKGQIQYRATTAADGAFVFDTIDAGSYRVSVLAYGKHWTAAELLVVRQEEQLTANLQLSAQDQTLRIVTQTSPTAPSSAPANSTTAESSQGIRLSSNEVSSLPLNERDFSKLLLLAAGTMTDANGAANFTQQFSVNGQRA